MIATDLEDKIPMALPETPSVTGEGIRYLLSSLAALALDAGLLGVGVVGLALPSWIAGAFAYSAGLILIYLLSIRWVFAKRAIRNVRTEFLAFAVLGVVGLVLNSLTLFVATGLGAALPVAKAVSAVIGFITNFISRKVLLFSGHRS